MPVAREQSRTRTQTETVEVALILAGVRAQRPKPTPCATLCKGVRQQFGAKKVPNLYKHIRVSVTHASDVSTAVPPVRRADYIYYSYL